MPCGRELPPHHFRPHEQVLGQELPALVEDGYTSFKIFMTYEGLALKDRENLDVMSVAREPAASSWSRGKLRRHPLPD